MSDLHQATFHRIRSGNYCAIEAHYPSGLKHRLASGFSEEEAHRVVACLDAFAGIPTNHIAPNPIKGDPPFLGQILSQLRMFYANGGLDMIPDNYALKWEMKICAGEAVTLGRKEGVR